MRRVPGEDPNGVAYEPLPTEDGMKTSHDDIPLWWRRLREWWARKPESRPAGWLKPVAPPRPTAQPPGPPPRGLPPKPPLTIQLVSDRNALTEIELVAVRLAECMGIDELGEGLDVLCAAWLKPDELTPAQSAIQLTALAAHAIVSARRLAAM